MRRRARPHSRDRSPSWTTCDRQGEGETGGVTSTQRASVRGFCNVANVLIGGLHNTTRAPLTHTDDVSHRKVRIQCAHAYAVWTRMLLHPPRNVMRMRRKRSTRSKSCHSSLSALVRRRPGTCPSAPESYDRNRPAGRLYMNTRGHATTADPGLVIPLRGISNESRGFPHECGTSRARRSAHGAYCCYRIAHWRMLVMCRTCMLWLACT